MNHSFKNIVGAIVLFICFLLLFSCKEQMQTPSETIKKTFTAHGNFEYEHHIKTGDPLAKGGDTLIFHYCLRNGENAINCTQNRQKPLSLVLPPRDVSINPPKPLYEGLKLMSVGDSITIYYPLPEDQEKPNGFKDAEFVTYDIKVLEIKPQKER